MAYNPCVHLTVHLIKRTSMSWRSGERLVCFTRMMRAKSQSKQQSFQKKVIKVLLPLCRKRSSTKKKEKKKRVCHGVSGKLRPIDGSRRFVSATGKTKKEKEQK